MRRSNCLLMLMLGAVLHAGCSPMGADPADGMLKQAGLQVTPEVLDQYVGTYRLASGAHFPVVREGNRLLGGTPLHELVPETTRQFGSNRLAGEFHFERTGSAAVVTLRRRLGKQDYLCERIDPKTVPDPTRRVAVGGHRLRMLVSGSGSPTIVMEDGIGNGIDHQAELQSEIAKITTTVTYDHAGTGGSEDGPLPRDALRIARELRLALENAGLEPPFVLIGGSIGAEYIRIFANEFPGDTTGLILIDPTPDWDRLMEWAEVNAPNRVDMYRRFERDAEAMMDHLMSVQEPGRSAAWAARKTTQAQARLALPLPDIRVIQITGAGGRQTEPAIADKIRFFDAWLKQHIPQAEHVLAPHSGHAVTITDRPLVIAEVQRLVKSLRLTRASER